MDDFKSNEVFLAMENIAAGSDNDTDTVSGVPIEAELVEGTGIRAFCIIMWYTECPA